MPELHCYPKPAVPRDVAVQICSYLRVQWPQLEGRFGDKLWNVKATSRARLFVLMEGEKLISNAEANFRELEHAGGTFTVGGLSTVFTYPAYRNGGHARQVVAAATKLLDESDADLAMLFCGEPLQRFYASFGWEPAANAQIRYGDRAAPDVYSGGVVMMRFITTKGRDARRAFESEPVYVGERTW
jgi:hypothetical protein